MYNVEEAADSLLSHHTSQTRSLHILFTLLGGKTIIISRYTMPISMGHFSAGPCPLAA